MPKERKAQQRASYHQAFPRSKIHYGHGTRPIKKKEQAALGSSSEK